MTERENKKNGAVSVDTAFVVVLFCLFVVAVLMVLMTGAGVYKRTAQTLEDNFNRGTAIQMLSQKVRNYDRENTISVKSIDGQNMLLLSEQIDGEDYITYIYGYDGGIRELFVPADYDFKPQDGNSLFSADNFTVSADKNLISISYEVNGVKTCGEILLRSGEVIA